jgi:glycosyltransferase involved in cell wall biosynthesis
MRVSVIITTYQRTELLKKAVRSVLNQNFEDFELIIVNDCPEDTLTWVEDNRIKIINNPQNLGGTKSLNIGLREAKGEYIAILDDDDEWVSPHKLFKQVAFLEKNQDYVAVGCDTFGVEVPQKLSLDGTPFAHSSLMFRNNGITYNENLTRGKDLDLFLRLVKIDKIGFVENCYIKYNDSEDLKKKINDCYWHRKVIWLHRKDYPFWFISYFKVFKRQVRLTYYDRIKNPIKKLWSN